MVNTVKNYSYNFVTMGNNILPVKEKPLYLQQQGIFYVYYPIKKIADTKAVDAPVTGSELEFSKMWR